MDSQLDGKVRRIAAFAVVFVAGLCVATVNVLWTAESNAVPQRRRLDGQFPKDLLLTEPYGESENKHLILAHILGIVYMFTGLSIICDEYFVPALEVMVDRWEIIEDVAGATFMAAGGSAPELFTSIMGVFVSENDVGFGTIVGSAVFNVLFVIGLCGICAERPLDLTWWPLFRDCTYYSISLMVLVFFIRDNFIEWYEAVLLFMLYFIYVLIMRNNGECRKYMEAKLQRLKRPSKTVVQPIGPIQEECVSEHSGSGVVGKTMLEKFKGAALRKVMELQITKTVASEQKEKTKFNELTAGNKFAVAAATVLRNKPRFKPDITIPEDRSMSFSDQVKKNAWSDHVQERVNSIDTVMTDIENFYDVNLQDASSTELTPKELKPIEGHEVKKIGPEDTDESSTSTSGKFWHMFSFPLVLVFSITIPNCSIPEQKKRFIVSFAMSLIWIALCTYFMVWWATIIGDVLGIDSVIMGVTILAAGTSIPDALTSVSVARRGYGDMAVSSSIGSNIFDILVGLPLPWIGKTCIISPGSKIRINSPTLVWSVVTLLSMVVLVISSIIYTKWKLNRTLGFIMFLLYVSFVIQTLVLEGLI